MQTPETMRLLDILIALLTSKLIRAENEKDSRQTGVSDSKLLFAQGKAQGLKEALEMLKTARDA